MWSVILIKNKKRGRAAPFFIEIWHKLAKLSKKRQVNMKPTFLTAEQVCGSDSNILQRLFKSGPVPYALRKYGGCASASDLAILLGAFMSNTNTDCEGRPFVSYWTVSADNVGRVDVIDWHGCVSGCKPYLRGIACRPVLSPDVTSKIPPEKVKVTSGINGAPILEYGEYPQTAVDKGLCARLDDMLMRGELWVGNKTYTFDTVSINNYSAEPIFKSYHEYILDNDRYVRLGGRAMYRFRMSNGVRIKAGQKYWVRVEPVKWLADPSGWWVSKDCLFAGIRFNPDVYYDGDFAKTDIASYMEDYFAPQMQCVRQPHPLFTMGGKFLNIKSK